MPAGRRSPRSQREVYRKIHACALELLDKLGHPYVISTLSREPLFSISEDHEVVCREGARPPPPPPPPRTHPTPSHSKSPRLSPRDRCYHAALCAAASDHPRSLPPR